MNEEKNHNKNAKRMKEREILSGTFDKHIKHTRKTCIENKQCSVHSFRYSIAYILQ